MTKKQGKFMTNKHNPAQLDCIVNSDLSSKYLDINSEVDNILNNNFKAKTGRPSKLTFTQLLYCLNLKREYTCETWLGLYRCLVDRRKIEEKTKDISLNLPSYANFLKSIKRLIFYLFQLIYYQTELNRQAFFRKQNRIAFVDSTPIPVCKVIRSSRHETMKDYAEYSKSTTGWYYGFKLHLTCDFETKNVLDFQFSNAKLDDRKYLENIMKNSFFNSETMFVADKGYQAQWLEDLAKKTKNYLLTGKKKSKNMSILASQFDIYLLHIRARIESIFSDLKLNCSLTSTRSRSVLGYLFNYISSIYFLIFKKII
jgi:penicillin-binding protein-related factor A (putative recombinase)